MRAREEQPALDPFADANQLRAPRGAGALQTLRRVLRRKHLILHRFSRSQRLQRLQRLFHHAHMHA